MPHYRDGTPAQIGDVVRGTGYNVKGPDGKLKEIVGAVVGITPDSHACNIQVAHLVTTPIAEADVRTIGRLYQHVTQKGVIGCGANGGRSGSDQAIATASIEYGQCDHFEKIG